jgi:structural maintenance of chromosome 3 (chondroitin sulfate proteoglycan 6)
VSRRGALTGGFYDTRRSRLDLQKSKLELTEKMEPQETEYKEHKSKLEKLESKMNNIVGEMQKTETRNSKNK